MCSPGQLAKSTWSAAVGSPRLLVLGPEIVTSALNWLDVSAEQQRRVREIIRLFEEPGTRDELGIGPVRDAFNELLFPGTSVIQTRARYFLFVPWNFQEAARRGYRDQALLLRVDRNERQLIERFRNAGFVDGLIGRLQGARVKTLPSTIYWGGLGRLGILVSPVTPRAVAQLARPTAAEEDELDSRGAGPWHPTLPNPPSGFPDDHSGGFDLTAEEAGWLQERILDRAEGTLLAHLVCGPMLADSDAPWFEPAARDVSKEIGIILENARRFSLAVHGASLLYNLLVSEAYERKGFTQVAEPVASYREQLTDWADRLEGDHDQTWDWATFWLVGAGGNARVPTAARSFVESWVEGVARYGASNVADVDSLRQLVESRVTRLRGGRSVLVNDKLLALWGGSSGASALVYRWETVRRLVLDVQEGLARAGT
jgi:Family of unknown function (DUF6361)